MFFILTKKDILPKQAFKDTIMAYPIDRPWSIDRNMVLFIPRLDAKRLPRECRNWYDETLDIVNVKCFVKRQFDRDIGHVGRIKIDETLEYMCFDVVIYIDGWYTTPAACELQRTIRNQQTKASVEYSPDARNRWFWFVEEKRETMVSTDLRDVGSELMCADGESDKCAICIESQHEHSHTRLDCGHCFHKTCITGWFKRSKTCPMCRKTMKSSF